MKNLLSLAMMGLTTIAFPVYANHKISGSIRLDVQAPFQPDSAPINLFLSRGRIDIKGDLAPDWTYKVRLDSPAMFNPNSFPIATLPVAKVTWNAYDSIALNFGLDTPNYSQADTENQTYIDRTLGVLDDSIGYKLGINANHVLNKTFHLLQV
jgi:hypothetical protein